MKLNIKQEKLFRMLLSANPVLTNCKGSVKAVRMIFNMLGLYCKINTPAKNGKIIIEVKNVTDDDLTPVKSILVKQLREILPINASIGTENIIGTGTENE